MRNVVEEFVNPIYMRVLHGNFLRKKDTAFVDKSKWILSEITDKEIDYMLKLGWREAIAASWIVSLGGFEQHLKRIKENLIPSRYCFSGQFHLIALARVGSDEAIDTIVEYLDTYLPVKEREYDQEWAYGALNWLDLKSGTRRTKKFKEEELWQIEVGGRVIGSLSPNDGVEYVAKVMEYIDEHFRN